MGGSHWYAVPDSARKSWCFLILNTSVKDGIRYISAWQLGYGNPVNFLKSETRTADSPDCKNKILSQLWSELDSQRYQGVTLITPSEAAISLLRTQLLLSDDIESASLHGYRHLALRDLLQTHFESEDTDFEKLISRAIDSGDRISALQPMDERKQLRDSEVEFLWEVRKAISTLVPADQLFGRPL